MVKIIFSDIDGTLINDTLKVTPRTRRALRHAVDTGILFVPVSARMPEAIKPILKDQTINKIVKRTQVNVISPYWIRKTGG